MQIRKIILFSALSLLSATATMAQDNSEDEFIALGDSCMQQYDTHAALAYYQQAYKQSPTPETSQKLANCLYLRCDYRQCALLLTALPTASLSHDAMRQLFFCYGYLKNDNLLISCGEELLRRFPMDAEVLARLCTVLCDNDKQQQAVLHAQDYYRRDSTNLLINRTLANSLYLNREYQASIQQYQKLMVAGDTTFLGLYSTGMAYDYLDNKQEAYHYLGMALKRNEKSPGCHYRFGVICIKLERYEEGLDHLYQAEYLLQPDKTILKIIADNKGKAYYGLQNYEMATEAWKTAREYDGSSLAFVFNIGSSYAALYEQYKDKTPEYEKAFHDMGTTPPELGQAKSYYSMFLEMAHDSDEELDDEMKQMVKYAQEYLENHP